MAKAPDTILKLVENFEQNLESFKSQGYNEATLRQEFINPFFEALGWDIQNKAGIAQAYKDVIHEDSIKIGTSTKAPDYCFRIGQTKKFFLEAKKPAVDIKTEISPAYQLRRYAWSAKLPLSILTDFEEFAVYDCQIRPNVNDKATTARIFYCTYKEYSEKWEQIANVFSKEAILKGLFDKYASEKTTKRGTTTVDKEFLAEIEEWRNELAKNIAIRNGKLSVQDLNFAVQKTIDRILFLRICEDRGIERSEQLLGLINGSRIYPRLFELFEKADEKYNSGIFHFRREKERPEAPDELSANLKVDDDVLKKIIKDLYYPCPYEFSIMPAEILGNVYEQFLGKVIRLTASHQAKVEEKPEVKKAGGVYYTPSYIVDYIVKNTVGKLCEGKTPKQIEKIKILDPACGSGSFLIGAYKYLLDYHRDYYEKEQSKYKKVVYQGKGGQWFLTIDEKKRILLNNIYGVDIDSQAAEVTKLSLLLKVLENETQESLRLFHERALPDLGNNIKCGNSLIGPDFYQNHQLNLFDDGQQRKINAFDWQKEFSEILTGKNPGFDAVIGNPPYGIVFNESQKPYLEKHYSTFVRNNENYAAFTQKAIDVLKTNGLFGYITPNTFLIGPYFDELKKHIMSKAYVNQIVDFGINQVFSKPNVFTALLFLQAKSELRTSKPGTLYLLIDDLSSFPTPVSQIELNSSDIESLRWMPTDPILLKLLHSRTCLDDIAWVKDVGLNYWTQGRGKKRGGSIADLVMYKGKRQHKEDRPYLKGRDIIRYFSELTGHWLRYNWQSLLDPDVDTFRFSAEFLEREKIIYRQTADRIIATIDSQGYLTDKTLHCIVLKDNWSEKISPCYILGLLNSNLMTYLYRELAQEKGRTFAQIKTFRVKQLPIRAIDFSKPDEVKKHDKMVSLVEEMLETNKKISNIKNPDEKTRIQRQIDSTDEQIDKLVYELYGLTEEEIKIVEEE